VSHPRNKVPLEIVLQQAGLVSGQEVKQALKQQQVQRGLKIGEILASQGQINSKTADFFAERWSSLLVEKNKQPIGQYLKQAGLLNEQQIRVILTEQKQTEQKFGELAIAKGWLRQATLDFFLRYLKPESLAPAKVSNVRQEKLTNLAAVNLDAPDENSSIFTKESLLESVEQQDYSQRVHEGFLKIKRRLLKIEGQDTYPEIALDQVLFWTGGKSFLTQQLFTLISDHKIVFTPGKEESQIDDLVQTKVLGEAKASSIASHFQTIEARLLNNQQCSPSKLLLLYQAILTKPVLVDDTKEEQELLNLGLVVRQQHRLVPANPIYQSVFDRDWAVEALNHQNSNSNNSKYDGRRQEKNSAGIIVTPQTNRQAKNNPLKFQNIVILLALVGLLTIFFNNIVKRMTVRLAFQTGNELLKQKSFNKAIEQYNKLLNIDSNYFQAWTNRGYALAGIQKYEEMRESCSAATIIDPTAVYAWNCQGEALHNLQRYEEAVAAFDKAIAINKTDPIFLINKSESLSAMDKEVASIKAIQEAIGVLEKIEAIKGNNDIGGEFAVALTFLGNGYRKQNQEQNAVNAYDRAMSYSPKYFPAQIGKGISLSNAQRYLEAEQEFKRILKNTSLSKAQSAQTWFHLGKNFCNSAQYDSGIAAFEQSIKFKPDYKIAEEAKKLCR
jgi:tetratricopeptide (TPR) repeat protein